MSFTNLLSLLSSAKAVYEGVSNSSIEADHAPPSKSGLLITICIFINWVIDDRFLSSEQKIKLLGGAFVNNAKHVFDEYGGDSSSFDVLKATMKLLLTQLKVDYFLERQKVQAVPQSAQDEVVDALESEEVDFSELSTMLREAADFVSVKSLTKETDMGDEESPNSTVEFSKAWLSHTIERIEQDDDLLAEDKLFILNSEVLDWKLRMDNKAALAIQTNSNLTDIVFDYYTLSDELSGFAVCTYRDRTEARANHTNNPPGLNAGLNAGLTSEHATTTALNDVGMPVNLDEISDNTVRKDENVSSLRGDEIPTQEKNISHTNGCILM